MQILILIIAVWMVNLFFRSGRTPRIRRKAEQQNDGCFAELSKVKLGNTEQWVLIRAENIANPIILFVHGGPGTSELTMNRRDTLELEQYFTVVNWDQRGAGKSYAAIRDVSGMHIGQFVSDIHALAEYLSKRFSQDKILLAGHSWGSVIGMLAVAQRPELYSGYIGIGQMSCMLESETISYEWTLQQARQANDAKAIRQLETMGAPPYHGDWQKQFMTQRQILGKFGGEYYRSKTGAFGVVIRNWLLSPEYTLRDRINFFRGIFASVRLVFPELMKVDLFQTVPEVQVPVWFMLGRHDFEVPSVLSAKYLEALRAPAKTLYWFENSAHLPNNEERDLFCRILIEEVLPVIAGRPTNRSTGV